MFSLTVRMTEDGEYETFDPTGTLHFIEKTFEELVTSVADWGRTQRTEIVLVYPLDLN